MKIKTIVNGKGEPQVSEMIFTLDGGGGETGKLAVTFLTQLIDSIKGAKTEPEVVEYYYIIAGFALCCKECGFLTEESLDKLMHVVEHIVDIELLRRGKN